MAHPNSNNNTNYPSFHFEAPFYGSEDTQPFASTDFAQWDSQGTQMGYNSPPSPSLSVGTTRSAQNPRVSTTFGTLDQHQLSQREVTDSRHTNYLSVPQPGRPRPSLDNANPILRFYASESPWSPEIMRSHNASTGNSPYQQSHPDFATYRGSPGNGFDQSAPTSDSGYQTVPSHHSVMSYDPETADQQFPPELTSQVGNFHVASVASDPGDVPAQSIAFDQASVYSGRSTTRSAGHAKEIQCPECSVVSKCRSDHKKHMLRHQKPFKCDIPNCKRGDNGFTTVNDLNRHKKSVHRIGALHNSYQCASENCRNKGKIWPRLDNFKQHISRMHKDEDEQDLIRRSEYHGADPAVAEESMTTAPMDTTLAGIGTERQFSSSSNELDDPVSGISLTPDQESHHPWSTLSLTSPSARGFDLGPDRSEPQAAARKVPDAALLTPLKLDTQRQAPPPPPASFQRLDALADIATYQGPQKEVPQPKRKVSTVSKVETEPQREDLLKFSKSLVNIIQQASNNNSGEDLEHIILRALSTSIGQRGPLAQQLASQLSIPDSSSDPTKPDHASSPAQDPRKPRRPSTLQTRRSPRAPSRRPSGASPTSTSHSRCEFCPAVVSRPCDMRKHVKRHMRPYGCTYPGCHKRFGAKSDWKRHENSQHFQQEAFRCRWCEGAGALFWRAKEFEAHLRGVHGLGGEGSDRKGSGEEDDKGKKEVEKEVRERRIGRNGQGAFWCGFCDDVVPLRKRRNEAWDERFDHVDGHFRAGLKIEGWVCLEGGKTKWELVGRDGEVGSPSVRIAKGEEGSPGEEGEEDGDRGAGDREEDETEEEGTEEDDDDADSPPASAASRKRYPDPSSFDKAIPPAHKRRKSSELRYCCECQGGPWGDHTFDKCMDCGHAFCGSCNSMADFVVDDWGFGEGAGVASGSGSGSGAGQMHAAR